MCPVKFDFLTIRQKKKKIHSSKPKAIAEGTSNKAHTVNIVHERMKTF